VYLKKHKNLTYDSLWYSICGIIELRRTLFLQGIGGKGNEASKIRTVCSSNTCILCWCTLFISVYKGEEVVVWVTSEN
jgi:hypothetical protein